MNTEGVSDALAFFGLHALQRHQYPERGTVFMVF